MEDWCCSLCRANDRQAALQPSGLETGWFMAELKHLISAESCLGHPDLQKFAKKRSNDDVDKLRALSEQFIVIEGPKWRMAADGGLVLQPLPPTIKMRHVKSELETASHEKLVDMEPTGSRFLVQSNENTYAG
eukprot:TRINITY_DN23430_c0_g1_i1.p1 TRINITY_DN23430_c0_g1~~TRINITY_DN23430_c0_g1_i1.p1  ORF type:complete len:133 (+),score=5.59 TRINITY_DN23430_c0_g1_i1:222-620(+)